jgi:hypothetical protein
MRRECEVGRVCLTAWDSRSLMATRPTDANVMKTTGCKRCWLVFLVMFAVLPVHADILDFTQLSREPSSVLNFYDQVTVYVDSLFDDDGLPAVQLGVGLGSALYGTPGCIDRKDVYTYWTGGNPPPEMRWEFRESVTIKALGRINSITFEPYFRINGVESFLPFEISVIQEFGPYTGWSNAAQGRGEPFTFYNFYDTFEGGSSLELSLVAHRGNFDSLFAYAYEHPGETCTFEYGFTVKAIDYTHVPDTTRSAALLTGPLITLMLLRRRFLAREGS